MPGKTVSRVRSLAARIALYAYCVELAIRDSAGAVAWALWFEGRPLCRVPGASRWWFSRRERVLFVALLELAFQDLARRVRP